MLASMRETIKAAEKEQTKIEAGIKARLKEMRRCPAGFDWHRHGNGWQCNGGSHFISNDELNCADCS